MVGRSERLRVPLRRWAPVDAGLKSQRVHQLSIAAVLIAALVAGLAVLFRPQPSLEPQPGALAVRVALPGLGSGAPQTLLELHSAGGFGVSATGQNDSLAAVTARRYATHLVADLVDGPRRAVAQLRTADQVQIVVAEAMTPTLSRQLLVETDEPLSQSVLLARFGLEPGATLPPYFSYEVQRGDTVEKLARRFSLQPESILFNNWEIRDPDLLEPGAQLTVPARDGVVYTVRLGDTLTDIAQNFAAEIDAILGFEGNNLETPDRLVEGATLLLVGGSASLLPGGGGAFSGAIPSFRWPIGGTMCDFFGSPRGNRFGFHTGIDVCAPTGTFIGAAAAGIVIQAGWDGGFGLSVLVDHGGGVLTRYAHQSHINVFLGQFVEAGDLIGFVGSTGYSTGPHVHFEILMGGIPQDPLVWLNS